MRQLRGAQQNCKEFVVVGKRAYCANTAESSGRGEAQQQNIHMKSVEESWEKVLR